MLTIGEILNRERKNKNLSLADIEKKTKIRIKSLKAIETSDWSEFPSRTYILGIISSYGDCLGLDKDKLSAFFRREYEKKESMKFSRKIPHQQFKPFTRTLLKLLIIAIFITFSAYFGFQLKAYYSPPFVEIIKPEKTTFSKRTDKFELIGKTQKDSIVEINKERAYLDDKQLFKTFIPLAEGKTKVTIVVTGANGKKTVLTQIYEKKR